MHDEVKLRIKHIAYLLDVPKKNLLHAKQNGVLGRKAPVGRSSPSLSRVDRSHLKDLVAKVGRHVYTRNGVLTDIKSFGTVQLGYAIKKLDGRHYQEYRLTPIPWNLYTDSRISVRES
ncbi:hypothetical protein Taro_041302 [Colocasia esculenta]|uniref:Uncharacterized protein n=1 Tax=Colocasia esculenta TaxID=4460 RepID=A0A843WWW7_COLES|nr:hypothetical protein [Colocasia esculenta]